MVNSLTGVISLFRVRDWYYFLPYAMLSVPIKPSLDWLAALRALLLAAGCLAFAYGLNQWRDIGLERCVEIYAISQRRLKFLVILAGMITLLLSFSADQLVFLATIASLLASFLYSDGPRLKRLPVVGTLTNAAIFAPIGLLGSNGMPLPTYVIALVIAFACLLLQNQLIHEAAHAEEDRRENIRTTYLCFGPAFVRIAITVLGLLAVIVLIWGSSSSAPWSGLTAAAVVALMTIATIAGSALERSPSRLRKLQRWASFISGGLVWIAVVWF